MKINVTPQQFADIVSIFLLDKIANKEEILPNHEEFNEIIDDMEKRGMKSKLLHRYMNLEAQERIYYRRIKEVFTNPKHERYTINIMKDEDLVEEEEEINDEKELNESENSEVNKYYIKEVVKRVLKEIRRRKLRPSRRPITEKNLDTIIERVLEYEQQ